MELGSKVTTLENEFKLIKGEVKEVLIDIREIMNNLENPFYETNLDNIGISKSNKQPSYQAVHDDSTEKVPVKNEKIEPPQKHEQAIIKQDIEPELIINTNENIHALKEKQVLSTTENVDLFTVIELMKWVDHTLKTNITKDELNGLLDLYGLTGNMNQAIQSSLQKIITIAPENTERNAETSIHDYIIIMVQLNSILSPDSFDPRIISSVYQEMTWREQHPVIKSQ